MFLLCSLLSLLKNRKSAPWCNPLCRNFLKIVKYSTLCLSLQNIVLQAACSVSSFCSSQNIHARAWCCLLCRNPCNVLICTSSLKRPKWDPLEAMLFCVLRFFKPPKYMDIHVMFRLLSSAPNLTTKISMDQNNLVSSRMWSLRSFLFHILKKRAESHAAVASDLFLYSLLDHLNHLKWGTNFRMDQIRSRSPDVWSAVCAPF